MHQQYKSDGGFDYKIIPGDAKGVNYRNGISMLKVGKCQHDLHTHTIPGTVPSGYNTGTTMANQLTRTQSDWAHIGVMQYRNPNITFGMLNIGDTPNTWWGYNRYGKTLKYWSLY